MENSIKASAFDMLKRRYEIALASGADTSAELTDLATAVANSVAKKCADPQGKTAGKRIATDTSKTVCDSGCNPAIVALRRGINADRAILESTRRLAEAAEALTFTEEGDAVNVIADSDAYKALHGDDGRGGIMSETLTDGFDLVQTAALAILEQATEHADGGAWLDRPYTVRRLSRKVYIQTADSAAYKDVETTPIQEVYRVVRRAIDNSRAMQTDPRNGYTYLEEMTEDGADTIYRRMRKWEDMGSDDNCVGLYSADGQTVADYESTLAALNLTARQAQIVHLRMQGKGYKAIATYLGITPDGVKVQMRRLRDKCAALGFTPDMWAEMTDGDA